MAGNSTNSEQQTQQQTGETTGGSGLTAHIEAIRKGMEQAATTEIADMGEAVLSRFPSVDMRIEHAHQEAEKLQEHLSNIANIAHIDGEAASRMAGSAIETTENKLREANSVQATELASEYVTAAVIGAIIPGKGMEKAGKLLEELEDAGTTAWKTAKPIEMPKEHAKQIDIPHKEPAKPIDVPKETAKAWEGDTNPSKDHDPALMHGYRNGPVEIDGVRYEHGKAPEQVDRKPLELEPIDKPVAMPPRTPHRAGQKESVAEEDHTVRNMAIGATAAVGLVAAGVGGKQYLDNDERKGRVTLSDAYKGAIQDALTLSDADRNARYADTIKQHPELKEAIAGYEMVRLHAAKDGKMTENDKAILELVASNTNIQILNGKVMDIKVTAEPFQQAARDADHQAGPSAGL